MNKAMSLEDIDQIKEASTDFASNIYSANQLQNKTISMILRPTVDCCFWIVKQNGYYRLFFAGDKVSVNKKLQSLKNEFQGPVVIDIITRQSICAILDNTNFKKYMTLWRLSMGKTGAASDSVTKTAYAELSHVDEIEKLFMSEFDVLVDQIPDRSAIQEAVLRQEILVIESDHNLKGFLWYEVVGKSAYVRYWCVAPKYREQKIGGTLLKSYFAHNYACMRHILWVKENNDNAIKRYRHYGYRHDGTYDLIYVME